MYSFFSCREKRTFSEIKCFVLTGTGNRLAYYANIFKLCKRIIRVNVKIEQSVLASSSAASQIENNPQLRGTRAACRRLLFPFLHAEKGRLRNAVTYRVPASRWQGILFRINCEIISG